MKNILVTGGTGSIGSELISQLLKKDIKKIIVFSRDEIKQFKMGCHLNGKKIDYVIGDIRDISSLENVFIRYKIDTVFHTAAMKHLVVCENEPMESTKTNIIGTDNLIKLSIKYNVNKVVTISTDKAASPTSVMGATKYIAERITLNANKISHNDQSFCCVRFGNVANSRGSVIPTVLDNVMNGKDIWISNPNVTRFIMRISDAVKLVLRASEITQGGEIFVLKMRSFSLGDLGNVMKERIAPRYEKDVKITYGSLTTGEKIHEDLLNKIEYNDLYENEEMYIVYDKNVKHRLHGFKPCKIESYDSSEVKLLDHDELEGLILEHIENLPKSFSSLQQIVYE